MIDAHRVVFNGMDSLDFDITPHLSFDGDNGGSASFLNRDSIHSEHYDGSFRRIHSYKYNEVLSPTFTFVKQDFSDFDETENRKILSWLTASNKPGWIEIYKDDSNVLSYKLFGNFIETEVYKLGNGRVVGYVATFESSAPYAYSRKFIYPEVYATIAEGSNNDEDNDYLEVRGTNPITITCNTDEYNKPIYPTVTIKFSNQDIYFPVDKDPTGNNDAMISNVIYAHGDKYYINLPSEGYKGLLGNNKPITSDMSSTPAGSDLYDKDGYYYFTQEGVIAKKISTNETQTEFAWKVITEVGAAIKIDNTTAGTSTVVSGAAIGETIVLDGTNKVISAYTNVKGALVQKPRIIGNHFSWDWLPLNYGDNNITITGNCDVKIEWIEPRKVGSL